MTDRSIRAFAALSVITLPLAAVGPANAQDAAETAVITAGTSGQGKAARSLGNAISGSLNSAAGTVRSGSSAGNTHTRAASRAAQGQAAASSALPAGVDALEGTDAASYQIESGATIRVSGGFVPSASSLCRQNCPVKPKAETPD